MKIKSFSPFLFFTLLFSFLLAGCSEEAGSSTPKVNMEPGMWEVASSVESSSLPMNIPASVSKQCLTELDFVPQANESQANCEISDLNTSGDRVSYTLTCSAGGTKTVSKSVITYHGTTMDGTIKTEMTGGPTAVAMTYKLEGKRIGDCP